jgi:hypothetical protein
MCIDTERKTNSVKVMKANEAPEKIYISNYSSGFTYNWHFERLAEKDIEYTRTDAFIENTVNWLINNTDITPTGIKNYRKAMKRE